MTSHQDETDASLSRQQRPLEERRLGQRQSKLPDWEVGVVLRQQQRHKTAAGGLSHAETHTAQADTTSTHTQCKALKQQQRQDIEQR